MFGLQLPATVVFDYPTPAALAALCAAESERVASGGLPETTASAPQLAPQSGRDSQAMMLDACASRFSSKWPRPDGDGFELSIAPFARWDADSPAASARLGARFGR